MKFKNVLLLIPILLLACDKEETMTSDKPVASAIEQRILSFKAELTSNQKEDVLYSIDEAEWSLEALLNFEEANNDHNYHGLKFVNDIYVVNSANGKISSTELLSAYNYFLEKIVLTTQGETIFSDLVNLEFVESGTKEGEIIIDMTLSYGSSIQIYNYVQFVDGEDWWWGLDGGACGDNQSTDITDAADLLQYKFNHPLSSGQPGFYTDATLVEVYGFDLDPDPNHPRYPTRTLMVFYYTEYACLDHEELNYYLNKFDYIKNLYKPQNQEFKSVEVEDDVETGTGGGTKGYYLHRYKIQYATFTIDPNN